MEPACDNQYSSSFPTVQRAIVGDQPCSMTRSLLLITLVPDKILIFVLTEGHIIVSGNFRPHHLRYLYQRIAFCRSQSKAEEPKSLRGRLATARSLAVGWPQCGRVAHAWKQDYQEGWWCETGTCQALRISVRSYR